MRIRINDDALEALHNAGIETVAKHLVGKEFDTFDTDDYIAGNGDAKIKLDGRNWWVPHGSFTVVPTTPAPAPVPIFNAGTVVVAPLFEQRANATLAKVTATFGQRGTEYGDTWRNGQWLAMKAVAKKLGIEIEPSFFRALAAAALVDVKYQRAEGGYKEDNLIDGIAYAACLAAEMEAITSVAAS